MFTSTNNKKSLYVTLGIIIISTVAIIMALQASLHYNNIKQKIIYGMKQSSSESIVSLNRNLSSLIASYAVSEYDKMVLNEMSRRNIFAIVVEDYNMGKIFGTNAYVSGKIRSNGETIVDFDPENQQHQQWLDECFYSDRYDITSFNGKILGAVSIYFSGDVLDREINDHIVETIFNTSVIIILLVVTLFWAIRLFVLKPISNIVEIINHSDEDGIPFELVPHHGSREIHALSHTMNIMINSIKDSRVALKEQKQALHYQAHHDALTGLANRFLFIDRLEQGIEKSKRNKSRMALLFIDLDHFKEINDSFGHKTGDKVLELVTRKLSHTIRGEDTLARLGGDEFTVMIEGLKDNQDASLLAEKIIHTLSEPLKIEEGEFYIGSSIGISVYPDNGNNSEDLLKHADAAMYKAKNEGRNNFQYYSSEMTEKAFERVSMEASLRAALKNDELLVYYQPQMNAVNDTLIGVEALVRWQHPTMGFMPPSKFIPVAESTGLILDLDLYVLKNAMIQLVEWYKQGLNPGVLAVNLSVKQFQQTDFVETIQGYLEETGCKPQWLELEVTESQLMKNPDQASKILHQLHEFGIKLALDDFGTGYSSLSYLKKLPLSRLKIDRSFIGDLPDDNEDASITQAIIALAQSLKMDLIAEGAETIAQKEFLIEHGCENIQGYLYGKPMPASEMMDFLSASIGQAEVV